MTSIKYVEPPPPTKDEPRPVLPWLVVVGAAGPTGARKLAEFIAALPPDLPAALLVSLHGRRPKHAELSSALHRTARLAVVTAYEGEPLHAGVCYVAGDHQHLCITGVTAHLIADPAPRGRSIDRLFETAAAANGIRVAGVLLPGAGRDGREGLAAIVKKGGRAFALRGAVANAAVGSENVSCLSAPVSVCETPEALARATELTVRGR